MAKPRGTIPLLPLLQTALAAGLVGLACRVALLHARLTALEPGGRVPSFITPQHQYPGRARGAARGRVACDADVSRLVSYWSDPRSDADRAFRSPFLPTPGQPRYLSFEPDLGGWNNIRMQFETMAVLAAATGRTLILPPDNPMYLLRREEGNLHRGIQDFLQGFNDTVPTISLSDFFLRERASYLLPRDAAKRAKIAASMDVCVWMAKADNPCLFLFDYLTELADFVPAWHGERYCLIMDEERWRRGGRRRDASDSDNDNDSDAVKKFCAKREPVYYDAAMHDAGLLHVRSHRKDTRLLASFYTFIHFTNPRTGNYYRRLVRDRVRYTDQIFCAAGKVVAALLEESRGVPRDGARAGAGYFAMHIRRGDFQWRKMRLSAEEWFENTRTWLRPDHSELLYIATDETNRTFFAPLMKHYRVSFLDDYAAIAGLDSLDPNYGGMIDQVVASRSSVFVGTYFSSFSAYIGRTRGYHGLSGKKMYYSHPGYWNQTHSWIYPHTSYSAREYPLGWAGIDEDDEPSEADFY